MRELSSVILELSISVNGTRELQGFHEKSIGDTNMSITGVVGSGIRHSFAHAEEND
jgi:hypothetical protein